MFNKLNGGGLLPPKITKIAIIKGLIGGTLGILFLNYLSQMIQLPFLMAPFGATCVLLFAVPSSPLAQPRNIIGGHLISALIGLLFLNYIGVTPLSLAFAVGLSIAMMQFLQIIHPPAGANPIVIMLASTHYGFDFLIFPVLFGSVGLVLIGLIINNLGIGVKYPLYWLGKSDK